MSLKTFTWPAPAAEDASISIGTVISEPSTLTSAGPALCEMAGARRFIHSGSGLGLETGAPVAK